MSPDHQSLELVGVRHKELPSLKRDKLDRYQTEEKQPSLPLTAVPKKESEMIVEKNFLRTNSQSTIDPATS